MKRILIGSVPEGLFFEWSKGDGQKFFPFETLARCGQALVTIRALALQQQQNDEFSTENAQA